MGNMVQAKTVLTKVTTVLDTLHANGIVHGDLHRHCDNVMINIERKKITGDAMLIDWGTMMTEDDRRAKKHGFEMYLEMDGKGFARTVKHVLECTKVNGKAEKLEKAKLYAAAEDAFEYCRDVKGKGKRLISEWS